MADTMHKGRPVSQERIRYFAQVEFPDGSKGVWPKLFNDLPALQQLIDDVTLHRGVAFWAGAVVRARTTYIGGGVHG